MAIEVGHSATLVSAMFDGVKRGEAKCFLRFGDLFGIGGVPLGDAGVEVPAVEVDTLAVGVRSASRRWVVSRPRFSRCMRPTTTSATWTPVLSM